MRPACFVSSALLCCPLVVTAWPWPGNAILQVRDLLLPHLDKRAPQGVQTLGSTDAATPNPSDSTATPMLTSDSSANTNGPTSTFSSGNSGKTKPSAATDVGSNDSSNSTSSKTQSSTAFDPRLPPGGISMMTPAPTASSEYYKIGNYITFGWNYTSLSVTPTAIDILASCSTNQATYTIALNQSVSGPTGAVTWDTGEYQKTATVALLTGKYTLIIYNADSSISAPAAAGYLDTYNQFTFGMYTPQPYVALDGYHCATCSGAMGMFNRQTLGFAVLMASISVITFTWFAGSAGVFF